MDACFVVEWHHAFDGNIENHFSCVLTAYKLELHLNRSAVKLVAQWDWSEFLFLREGILANSITIGKKLTLQLRQTCNL